MPKVRTTLRPFEVIDVSEQEAAYLDSQGWLEERLADDDESTAEQPDAGDVESDDGGDDAPDDAPPARRAGRGRKSTPTSQES
jgi:hypothetical protein